MRFSETNVLPSRVSFSSRVFGERLDDRRSNHMTSMDPALESLKSAWPDRAKEVTRLYQTIGEPGLALPLYIHGPSGCGKSAVLRAVIKTLEVPTAYLDCVASPTAQALFESALNQLANHRPSSQNGYTAWSSCDSVGAFVVGLKQIVKTRGRVCIVFDKAERLASRGGGTLLHTILELPSLFAAASTAEEGDEDDEESDDDGDDEDIANARGSVLPIFVGETLWVDFQRCDAILSRPLVPRIAYNHTHFCCAPLAAVVPAAAMLLAAQPMHTRALPGYARANREWCSCASRDTPWTALKMF